MFTSEIQGLSEKWFIRVIICIVLLRFDALISQCLFILPSKKKCLFILVFAFFLKDV